MNKKHRTHSREGGRPPLAKRGWGDFPKNLPVLLFAFTLLATLSGCFREIAETRQPLPDLIWPTPPDAPRIVFVNSITMPEDLNIRKTLSERLLNFVKGETGSPLVNPRGVITDNDGRLFVVDNFTRQVHVFDAGRNEYYTFPQNETDLVSPVDIAVDNNGYVYITDSKTAVVRVFKDHGRKYIAELGKGEFKRPTGIAVNRKTGELLVVDTLSAEIVRYDLSNHTVTGRIGKSGIGGGDFHYPTNIFVARDGRIFVADSLNFRIQIFSPDGEFLSTFGEAGDRPGYFARPKGVAVDSDGNIYVVDAMFDAVQIFNSNGDVLMDFGGTGSEYGKFWLPSGIYIDKDDRIYVADSYNKRIQVFRYLKADSISVP